MRRHLSSLTVRLVAYLLSFIVTGAWPAGSSTNPAKPKSARPARIHSVLLGGARREPYSVEGDAAGAQPGETELLVRPVLVDGRVRDWTTGNAHDVTERSFVVRRALRINDTLPGDTHEQWVWQRGPWILVDRTTGKITPLKLADFGAAVSQVSWFRDYAAYCGVTGKATALYAVVSQLAERKPLLVKKLAAWSPAAPRTGAACLPAIWQRDPMQVTFQATGGQPASFVLAAASTALVEPGDEDGAPSP